MQTDKNISHEDEIDLRELFITLKKNKKIIFIVTTLVTLLAIVYVMIKTPIYEASTLVEIGNYKLNNNNNKILLDNPAQLSKELTVIFVDMNKNKKDLKAKITKISIPKKSKSFIEINSEGYSNALATAEIKKVVEYIQQKHQKILNDVSERRKFEIETIERKIHNIKTKETKLLDKKILLQEISLRKYTKQLNSTDQNLKKLEKSNPTLAALLLMEKRNLSDFLLKLNMQLLDLKDKKNNLDTNVVWDLEEKKNFLASMLLPHNYKNSHIVGDILTNNYPAKPKKKLIVVVAFITGLILSVFLVFFLEFLKGFKEEEKSEAL